MSYLDNEIEKMVFADRCRQEGTHRFQGCKECKSGFYLQTYSEEGLCSNCELKYFPERFFPCLFCRAPLDEPLLACSGCETATLEHVSRQENCNNYVANAKDWKVHNKLDSWYLYASKFRVGGDFEKNQKGKYKKHNWSKKKWPGFFTSQGNKKLSYLPKVRERGICVEEPWQEEEEEEEEEEMKK